MKEVVLETAEDDIEEIPHLPGLPKVNQRDEPGTDNIMNLCMIDFQLHIYSFDLLHLKPLVVPRGRDDGEKISVHGEQQSEL